MPNPLLSGLGPAPKPPVLHVNLGDTVELRFNPALLESNRGELRLTKAQQRKAAAADILQQGTASMVTSGLYYKLSRFGQMGGEYLFEDLWGKDPSVTNKEELKQLYGAMGSVIVSALLAPFLGIVHRFVEAKFIQARRALGTREDKGVLVPGRFSGVDYSPGHAYRNAREDQEQIQKLSSALMGAVKEAVFPFSSVAGATAGNAMRRYTIDSVGRLVSGALSESIIILRNPEKRPMVFTRVSVPNPDSLRRPNRVRPSDGESLTRLRAGLASSAVNAGLDLAIALNGYSTRGGVPTSIETAMGMVASMLFGAAKGYFTTATFLEQRARMDGDRPRRPHPPVVDVTQRRASI